MNSRERCMIFADEPTFPEVHVATREESIRIAHQYLAKALEDEDHREVYVADALLWLK